MYTRGVDKTTFCRFRRGKEQKGGHRKSVVFLVTATLVLVGDAKDLCRDIKVIMLLSTSFELDSRYLRLCGPLQKFARERLGFPFATSLRGNL